MHNFAFVDETLDINLTQSYKLSIQVSLNGLSFCILDPIRAKYIAFFNQEMDENLIFDDFLNAIEDYINGNELLNKQYKSTRLIWLSKKNILIPNVYFNKENIKSYFEFNQKIDELDEIHFNELKYVDAYSVFIVPSQIAGIFSRKYQKIEFYNQQIPFIEQSLFKYHTSSKKVLVNVNKSFIDLCITVNGKLLLYNNFVYKAEMDIIYFILYVFDQFNLNTLDTELILSGLIDRKANLCTKLKDFVNHLKFDKPTEDYSYSYTFNQVSSHKFTNLFNLLLCE